MRYASECALGCLGVAAAAGILVAALEVSIAAIPAPRGVDPASVVRTLKGDRLPSTPDVTRASPIRQLPDPKLPEGCLAAVDWHTNIFADIVAGRCVA